MPNTQGSKGNTGWVCAKEEKLEGRRGTLAPTLERKSSAQLGAGRSRSKRLLVWVTVKAGSEEGRPAGQEPPAKGLSVEGG